MTPQRITITGLLLMAALLFSACGPEPAEPPAPESTPTDAGSATPPEVTLSDPGAVWQYPETRQLGKHIAVLHAPQIQSWEGFDSFQGLMAIEFYPDGDPSLPLYAVVNVSGDTSCRLLNTVSGLSAKFTTHFAASGK